MKEPRIYVEHAPECVARIERYRAGGQEAFLASEMAQDAVLRNLQTMGQLVGRLPEPLLARYPEVPWRAVVGFRNVLVHDYLGIHLPRVWRSWSATFPLSRWPSSVCFVTRPRSERPADLPRCPCAAARTA